MWRVVIYGYSRCMYVYDGVFLCCPFSPRDVLDEILNFIESVSGGFPTYSFKVLDGNEVFSCVCIY